MNQLLFVEEEKSVEDLLWLFRLPYDPMSYERFYYFTAHVADDGKMITTDGNWMRFLYNASDELMESDWQMQGTAKGSKRVIRLVNKSSDRFWSFPPAWRFLDVFNGGPSATRLDKQELVQVLFKFDMPVDWKLLASLEDGEYDLHVLEKKIVALHQPNKVTIFPIWNGISSSRLADLATSLAKS